MKLNKRKISLLVSISLISFLIGGSFVYLVYGQTASTFWVSSGVYPRADFTFWREGSYYFVKNSYGQIPSWGESTNASALLQILLNLGGHIVIGPGRYYMNTTVVIGDNTVLEGSGPGITTLYVTANVARGIIQNSRWALAHAGTKDTNITIRNLSFDGYNVHETALSLFNVNHFHIENVHTRRLQFGDISYSNYGVIENNIATDIGFGTGAGIGIGLSHDNEIKVANNIFAGSPNDEGEGTYILNSTNIALIGNTWRGFWTTTGKGEAIDIKRTSNNIQVIGNTILNSTNGIYNFGNHVTISNNYIMNMTSYGITNDGGNSVTINDNILENNTVAIRLTDFTYTQPIGGSITGNIINGTVITKAGIQIFTANTTTVTGNTFSNVYTAIDVTNSTFGVYSGNNVYNVHYGFREQGTSNNNVVTSSSYRFADWRGIWILGANTKVHLCWNGTTWMA